MRDLEKEKRCLREQVPALPDSLTLFLYLKEIHRSPLHYWWKIIYSNQILLWISFGHNLQHWHSLTKNRLLCDVVLCFLVQKVRRLKSELIESFIKRAAGSLSGFCSFSYHIYFEAFKMLFTWNTISVLYQTNKQINQFLHSWAEGFVIKVGFRYMLVENS